MKFWLCLFALSACTVAHGQEANSDAQEAPAVRRDPTAPSVEILKRLAAAAPAADVQLSVPPPVVADEIIEVAPAPPTLVLKGLVLSDPDHGTAMFEVAGARVTVRLARQPRDSATLPAPHASRLAGFSAAGIEFHVLDFNDRAVLLQAPDRSILVSAP